MGFLEELDQKYTQETPKEEPTKPSGFLGELESKYKDAPVEQPKSFLGELEQKYDVNPDSLRNKQSRGEPISAEQERVVFDANRARSAGEQASAIGKGVFTSLSEMVPQAFEGTKKIIGASKDLTKQIGIQYLDVNPLVPEIAVNYIAGNTAEERKAELEKAAKKEADVVRSAASGAVQAGEEVINEAARGAFFGTPLTDLIQEYPAGKFAFEAMKAGGPVALASEALSGKIFGEPLVDVQPITKDESFQRSMNRQSMRQQEQQEYKDLPERTTAALVKLAESSAGSLLGKSLGVPSDEQFQKDLVQELKNNAIVPDEDVAMVGNLLSPLDPTFLAAGPLARASSKAFDLASEAGLRALTKPTIAGMNPLEATGRVIRFGGEGTQKAARKLSDFLTGSEDSFIGKLADPVVAVTRRPGMIVEGAGRALRDIGRQIDDVGIRSRTGIIERAGQDAASGDFMRTVFGPGTEKAQAKALKAAEKLAGEGEEMGAAALASISKRRAAARTADWVFRQAEAVARYGTSGAAIGTALGLPDIENAEMLGQVATTGAMVGTIGAARLGEKGAKIVDPRVSLKGKIDAILADDPVSRRADEDADIERFRNTAAPDIINKADEFGNVNSVLQSFDGHIQNLVDQRNQAIARGENDVAAGMDLEIKKTSDSKDAVSKMTPDAIKEYQRRVDLTLADALDQAKTTGEAVGLNNIEIKLLSPVEMLGHLRDKWGTTLTNAEYVLQSLAGNNDLSDADQQKLNEARETINQFNSMYQTAMGQRGYAMSDNTYSDSPMHLRPANLKTPSVVINSELVKSQLGNNLYATLTHEVNHALRNFKEVKSMMAPLEEYLFGKKVQNADGSITEISKGIYDDASIDRMGDYYAELLGGDKWKAGFATEGQFRNYIKEEILSEAAGLSSNTANLRADLDSPGQAFVDWAATSNKNSLIGKLRDALGLKGVLLDDTGRISDILGESISPEVLALTRQFQRQLRDYNGSLSQITSATGPEVTISAVELLSSKILQNKYRGLDIWQKEQVLTIKDDEGNVVNEIVVPKSASLDPLVGQYRLEDGMLVDENGNKMQIAPEIAAANLPNNTNISVDQRIARNPDGSPKILSNREIQARARKRGEVLKNAIEGATEDGSTNRVRPVGDNEYAGILSPTQLQAILALPNDIVAPELKRKIAAFNETALRKDGTRMIVEYQAAMKGGKYKALAPKIRDVVPFGFRITKDGNFLATTISVSRIFDKINDWAKPNRNRLNLWNGDTNALWEDILHVLTNHQKGERGEVGLDVDPAMAMLKKDRINDIFNLFDKATESKNPDRSVSKTRKGQDSIDRVIMGMRMDRVNDFQISNAQKLPVDYGKIKENYMPNVPVDVVQNNVAEEGGLGYKESPTIKYREPKYETTNPPRLGYIDPRTTEEGQRVLRESPILAQAYDALERASEAGGDQRPTSGSSVIPAETEALREFANRSGAMESPEAVQKFTDDWNAENRTAGTEHQVLFGDKDRIEKRFTATYNDTWKNYLDRILLHNILFKDSAVKLEGFQEVPEITQDRNGQEWNPGLYAKISQPYAEGQQVDLIKDLKPYMESLGFVSNGPMNYYHPEYGVHVSDLHPGNAYVETDAQGNKHVTVFDPNLHLTGEKEGDAKERARVEAKLATQRPSEEVGFSWPQEVDAAIGRMRSVLENPQNMPTQVKPEAPLPVSLYEAGTSLESFGVNSLKEIAEHYGVSVPEKAKRGEIIDLVENRSSGMQFKPAAKLDETYAKAIESGDMEEAQRLVDERAREAFPNTLAIIPPTSSKQDISKQPLKILYHGTGSDFTEFKSGLPTADDWGLFGDIPTERHAIFFAEEKDFANEFAKARDSKRVIPAYINAEKPLVFDDAFDKYDELMDLKDPTDKQKEDRQTYRYIWNLRDKWEAFDGESGKEFVDWMRRKGFDSAILSETGYGLEGEPTQDVWAVLDPSQIKSADPATYDNEGKLIPLSERFNASSNDIRFRPAAKLDEDYLNSLRFDANPETAQTYVNEAAEKAGYDSSRYWYHGTAGDRFNVPKGRRGVAAHVSLNKDEAWNFAESAPSSSSRGETKPDVRTWYLKKGELFDPTNEDHLKKVSELIKPVRERIKNQPVSGQWALKEDIYNPNTWKDKIWDFFEDSEIQKFIKDAGFIGYMDRESPRTSWENTENAAIFDPNSLKEAARITLDDNRNIIPLSQRFDTSKPDIRFMPARKGDSPASTLSKEERDTAVKFLERGTLTAVNVFDALAKLANGDMQSITEKLSTGRLFELAHRATGTPILNRVDAISAIRKDINRRKDAMPQSSMASPMADDIIRTPVNSQAAQGLAFKPSERYTTVEVAPDPEDKKAVEAWNSFNEASKKIVTEKVANDMLPKIASDMGLPEPIITHIIGGFLKETNPSVLIEFPSDIPYENQVEFAKVAGHLLKQQAVITFDEANKTDDQAFFVGLTPSRELSYEETSELYKKINDQMEEAAGFTGKTDQLVFGNFSEMSNEDFYTKLKSVVDEVGTGVDYGINTVQHEFRSNYIETGSPDTLNETQYGKGNTQEGGTGGDSIRGAQGRFDALQTATNEAVRGAIESERASTAGKTEGVNATPQSSGMQYMASPMPQSAMNVLHADSADLPKPEKKITNARVAVNIADIAEKYWGGKITSETITPEQENQIIDNGAEEAIAALTASGKNAGNWYSTAIKAAIEVAGIIHKQLSSLVEANKVPHFAKESNPVEAAQFILRLPLAITSQNMSVLLNTRFSEEQYNHYVKYGEFDPSKQYGDKAKSISGNLKLANTMIKNHGGILQLQEFVKQEFTVRDLEKIASKIAGQKVTISGRKDDIVNGAAIFGPKIGQGFLQNLMGKFDPVTIDLWMRRTWGRWTGDVVGDGVTGTRLARLIDESRNSGRKLPPSLKNLRTVDRSLDVKKSGEPTKPVRTISENVEERLENDPEFRKDVETLAKEWNREFQKYYDFMGAPISPAIAQGIRDLIANEAPEADITKAYNKLIRSQSKIREDLDEAYKQLSSAQKRTAEGKNIPKDTWIAEQHAKSGRTEVLTNPEKNKLKPQWANAAKSIVAELNPIEIPTDQDRVVITRIVNGIRKQLEDKGYSVTNADIQAILWYPEKDLWAKLRGEEESNLNTSYDDEFIKIAEQRGLGAEAKAIAKSIRGY